MAWNLKGQLIETCSCNMFCPCWFGVQELMIMDQGWCAGALALRIDEGSADGLDLGGRRVVEEVYFPGPTLYDGNGTARLFIDDGASDEQRQALEPILQGQAGGQMEAIGGLISTWLPTETAAIGLSDEGDAITFSVDGPGEVKSELLRDPEGEPFTLRGGGFITGFGLQEAELAPASSRWGDAEMPLDAYEAKSGARGAFAWSD